MNEVVLYGYSDDIIVVESSTFPDEELAVWLESDKESILLAVSDGSLFRVRYDEDGIWRITPVVVGSSSIDVDLGRDDHRHSDRVTLTGDDLSWVVLGTQIAK